MIQTSAFETDFQMGNIKSLSFENGNKNGWYGRIRTSKKKAEKKACSILFGLNSINVIILFVFFLKT